MLLDCHKKNIVHNFKYVCNFSTLLYSSSRLMMEYINESTPPIPFSSTILR